MKPQRGGQVMKTTVSIVIIVALIFSLAASVAVIPAQAADECELILESMSSEERISQLIMPSFRYYQDPGGNTRNVTEMTPAIDDLLQRHGFAGIVLFAQNLEKTDQAVRLVDAFQKANASVEGRTQLLIAADQEGGLVTRLGQGTMMPGNMALGASGDTGLTAIAARIIGEELKSIGINMDLAPVIDVNSEPSNPVIGIRSFSDDPNTVASHGASFVSGLHDAGIIATVKHFPGHGDTLTDSHTGLPRIEKGYDELSENDLIPFKAAVEAGADVVMTAHIEFPLIETGTYLSKSSGREIHLPATLSERIITGILREEMGFDGVVMTDAMEMDAIARHFGKLDAARLAIEAGVDILLMPVDTQTKRGISELEQYIADLAAFYEQEEIFAKKVDAAVLRVLTLKSRYGLTEPYARSNIEERVLQAVNTVGSYGHHETEWEITKRTITLVKNSGQILPFAKENGTTVVLTAYHNEVSSMLYAVGKLREDGKLPSGADIVAYSMQGQDYSELSALVKDADHLILVSETQSEAALNPGSSTGARGALIDSLITYAHNRGTDVAVISAYLPYDAARVDDADAVVLCWGARGMSEDPRETDGAIKQYGPNLPAALYLMFSTDESPCGTLPVSIPKLTDDYRYAEEYLYSRGWGLRYDRFRDRNAKLWYKAGLDLLYGSIAKRYLPERVSPQIIAQGLSCLTGKGMAFAYSEALSEAGLSALLYQYNRSSLFKGHAESTFLQFISSLRAATAIEAEAGSQTGLPAFKAVPLLVDFAAHYVLNQSLLTEEAIE